jgi:hypothetical protein
MKFQHGIVPLRAFRKTDRAPLQPLDARAKIRVPPLKALGAAFMNLMFLRRQRFARRLPIIRVQGTHQFFPELCGLPSLFKEQSDDSAS